MRISLTLILLLVALALPANPQSGFVMPTMTTVDPDSGKVGDLLVVQGTNLDRDSVAALYLTDGTKDVKVPIVEQTATSIKFRIPPEAKPGRLSLMVLTKGRDPKFVEEPVKVTVEAAGTPSTPSSSALSVAAHPAG